MTSGCRGVFLQTPWRMSALNRAKGPLFAFIYYGFLYAKGSTVRWFFNFHGLVGFPSASKKDRNHSLLFKDGTMRRIAPRGWQHRGVLPLLTGEFVRIPSCNEGVIRFDLIINFGRKKALNAMCFFHFLPLG